MLTTCPVKELYSIWMNVVERIFCLGGRVWGVGTTLRSKHPREYQAIAAFLSSTGPLLSSLTPTSDMSSQSPASPHNHLPSIIRYSVHLPGHPPGSRPAVAQPQQLRVLHVHLIRVHRAALHLGQEAGGWRVPLPLHTGGLPVLLSPM